MADVEDEDEVVVDLEDVVQFVVEQTGHDRDVVEDVLALKHEYMIAIGLVEDSEITPVTYVGAEAEDLPRDIVDDSRIAADAERLLEIPEVVAEEILEAEMDYLETLGLVEWVEDDEEEGDAALGGGPGSDADDGEPEWRFISDIDAGKWVMAADDQADVSDWELWKVDVDPPVQLPLESIPHPAAVHLRGWCTGTHGTWELRVPGHEPVTIHGWG